MIETYLRVGDGMQFLKTPNAERVAAARRDGFGGGTGATHGRDAGHAIGDGVAANGLLVGERVAAGGGIDDELEAAGFEKIDRIGAAFVDFENGLARQAGGLQSARCAAGGEEAEAEFVKLARDFDGGGLVAIIDADEERAGIGDGRYRQRVAPCQMLRRSFRLRP